MLTTLLACAAISQTALPSQLQGVQRIVTLGDSITQMGADPKGYVTLLAQTLASAYPGHSIEVLNAGISGHKSTDMLGRFQKDVLDKKPQIVTINAGVNDVWHDFRTPEWSARVPAGNSGKGVPLPKYVESLALMIDLAQKAHIRVILLSPTLVYEDLQCAENQRLAEYVRSCEALAKERQVEFVNLYEAFRESVAAYQKHAGPCQLLLTTDGVHLNDAGNAVVATQVLRALGVSVPNKVAAQ